MKREPDLIDIPAAAGRGGLVVVDIGSTIVKVARVSAGGEIEWQRLVERDFEAGIAPQVEALFRSAGASVDSPDIRVCSSANGGLRIGIVCMAKHFSGAVLRNQVLLAGANPVFVHDFDENGTSLERVDMLLVGGGID